MWLTSTESKQMHRFSSTGSWTRAASWSIGMASGPSYANAAARFAPAPDAPTGDSWQRHLERSRSSAVADGSRRSIGPKALRVEQARLARFFETIAKHRRALDLAIEENFGGQLDRGEWRLAFESAEPHDANRTMVVTGDHSAILNAYVEILRASAGARLLGLVPHRRPHADQVFEAVVADGGLDRKQATLLSEIYVLEGRLEHASPDVDADEVREAIERFRQALPGLIGSTSAWLRAHGVEFG
jgi:hypothetical protein